ncbi:MAG: hypothetical protein U1F34_04745 [Gammaproteobacteria bacterium]
MQILTRITLATLATAVLVAMYFWLGDSATALFGGVAIATIWAYFIISPASSNTVMEPAVSAPAVDAAMPAALEELCSVVNMQVALLSDSVHEVRKLMSDSIANLSNAFVTLNTLTDGQMESLRQLISRFETGGQASDDESLNMRTFIDQGFGNVEALRRSGAAD